MVIHPIKTENDYDMALLRIDQLMDAEPGTPEGDELDVLVTLVDSYENARFPIDAANPVEAILFRMEQLGIGNKDLEQYIGTRTRVWEILNRKRSLSLAQIRQLHSGLNIPLENLISAN